MRALVLALLLPLSVMADVNTPTDMSPYLYNVEVNRVQMPDIIWIRFKGGDGKRYCYRIFINEIGTSDNQWQTVFGVVINQWPYLTPTTQEDLAWCFATWPT